MTSTQRPLKSGSWIVSIVSILSTCLPTAAQPVPISGTADVSAIEARLDDQQAQIDALREEVQAGRGQEEQDDQDAPGSDPDPDTPHPGDPDPAPVSGAIGINLGFVGRTNHPDDPTAPGYDELLKPVAGVARFMNPNRINDYLTAVDSLDAPHFYATQTWRQALTWQAELCQRIGADYYFNAPINATPGFVTEAVALIRSILDADQVIYVSWANEVWNGSLGPYREVKRITGVDAGGGAGLAFFSYWASRLGQTFTAARTADPNCVRVLETKTARDGTWFTQKVHERLPGAGADYDAVAITTYFSVHRTQMVEGMTIDQAFAAARENWTTREGVYQREGIGWATAHGKRAISYEGGQHFWDPFKRASLGETFRGCQTDPRIAELRGDVLDAAFEAGLDLHIEFDLLDWWNDNGYWGLADSLANLPGSLKYQSLVEFANRMGQMN